MKAKQLEEVKELRKNLGKIATGTPPNLERHVTIALCSGEIPKLKPAVSVAEVARLMIIKEHGTRRLSFSDVFASTNGYDAEMKTWNSYEAKRQRAVSQFNDAAEKIMIQAADPQSDASEIVQQLHDAVKKAGLKDMVPPQFV